MVIELGNIISHTQAAEILGVTRQAVYGMIDRCELHTVVVGGKKMLDRVEVEELAKRRQK